MSGSTAPTTGPESETVTEGASGATEDASGTGPAEETTDPAEGAESGAQGEEEGSSDGEGTGSGDDDAQLRSEEAKRHRLARRTAEQERDAAKAERDRVFEALKGIVDPDSVTPEATAEEVAQSAAAERDQARADAKAARLETAAGRAARLADVNEDDLLDSTAFQRDLAALDDTADDFRDQVKALVEDYADKRPSLRNTPPPAGASSSAPMADGGEAPPKGESIEDVRAGIRKRRGLG